MRANGKNLSLVFDTVEINCASTSIVLDNEPADADLVTFQDVVSGTDKRWYFIVTALSDYSNGTLWDLLWETPAFVPIQYTFVPYGNVELASPSQPHFRGEVVIDKKPPVGGDAGTQWTFEARLTCTADPERLVSGR